MPIETGEIQITPSAYVREIMLRWIGRYWWVVVLPFIGFMVAGVWNVAFLFVAFMWLFLIFPPVMMFVYFTYGLRPEVQHVIRRHCITIDDEGLKVTFLGDDDAPALPPRVIPARCVTGMAIRRRFVILELDNSRYELLLIPADLLAPDDVRRLVARFFDV